MNNICDDLQNIIFEFISNHSKDLSKLQLVCQRWKHAVQDRLDKIYWIYM